MVHKYWVRSLFMLVVLVCAACATAEHGYKKRTVSTFRDQPAPPWVANVGSNRCFVQGELFACVEIESVPFGADPNACVDGATIKARGTIATVMKQSVVATAQRLQAGYGYSAKDMEQTVNTVTRVIEVQGIQPVGGYWELVEERVDGQVSRNYTCYAQVSLDPTRAAAAVEESAKRIPEPKMGVSEKLKVKGDDILRDLLDAARSAF